MRQDRSFKAGQRPALRFLGVSATNARDGSGKVVHDGYKKGVPIADVWDIPLLNPKAKERVGYPTQKSILLLERIIALMSSPTKMP